MGAAFAFSVAIHRPKNLDCVVGLTPYFGLCEPMASVAQNMYWPAKFLSYFHPTFTLMNVGGDVTVDGFRLIFDDEVF